MDFDMFMLVTLIVLALFCVGLGFAVYGVIMFIRNRQANADVLRQRPPGVDAGSAAARCAVEPDAEPDGAAAEMSAHAAGSHAGPAAASFPTGERKTMSVSHTSLPWINDNNLLFRSLLIAALTLLLLAPLGFISEIVDERADLHSRTLADIAKDWGRSQVINGPALIVPYDTWRWNTEKVTDAKGVVSEVQRRTVTTSYKYILPKTVSFTAALTPQTRYRGIYHFVVYTTPIDVTGAFTLPAEADFGKNLETVYWDKAYLALGIADLKAITKVQPLIWDNAEAGPFSPGTDAGNLLDFGFHAPVSVSPAEKEHTFKLSLNLNGSGGIHFTPVGETTEISVSGDWSSPKFSGDLLPTTRTITDTNFTAFWSIPHLSRTYPQVGNIRSDGESVTGFVAGVDLYEMVSLYRMVTRAVKYGILFIGLTFVALLSFELATRSRLHLVQYGLVGIAMSLFYLVLLSLAEHTSFPAAFIAASAVSVAMNGLYIAAALRSKGKGLIITALLSGLYGVLYALLQMEDYALLVGTALVVLVVGVLMFLTRSLPVHSAGDAAAKK